MQKLERALAIYLGWLADDDRCTADELLGQHADLREFLEAMLAEREPLEAGIADTRRIGDFRIEGEIARGGMGVVFRARQLSLDRVVALKVLPAHVTLQPSAVARFRREASTAARLEHPGIVKIHAVGSDGDTHYFAMELIDGEPLARVDPRSGRRRSVRECVEIVAAVCDALAYAHEQGVIHRDVKPSNILVAADGQPVLTDFGLARDLDAPALTRTGAFAGSPHYVSPEQARGLAGVDARSDVFSLGATLYELLTDHKPFDGDSVPSVLAQITGSEPRDPLRLAPDLAPDLAAIVMKALEKDPARRYGSAAGFGADLRAFLEFRPVSARRESAWKRVRRFVRREPLRATLYTVLAIGVPTIAAGVGYLVANRSAIDVGSREIERRNREERLARVTIDYEAGDFVRALAVADEALAAAPRDVEARALRATVELALGRAHEALAEFDVAPGSAPLAEGDRGRVYVLTAVGRDGDARELEAKLGEPTTPEGMFLAGMTAGYRARSDDADLAQWREVRDLFAQAMHVAPAPRLHYYLRWLEATLMTREESAIARSVAALETLWPDSPAALLYVAYASRTSDPQHAIDCYRRVLASGYDHPRIHGTIADCLQRLGDTEGAARARLDRIASYRAREASGSMTLDDRVNFAIALESAGSRDEAIARVRDVTSRAPTMPRAFEVLGWLLYLQGDHAAAAPALDRAVELRPTDLDSWQRLGSARLALGDAAGAADALERVVARDRTRWSAHARLGAARLALRQFDAAIAEYRLALELEPRRAELHLDLATALAAEHSTAEAIASCERALELQPDHARARELLAQLKQQ
ncbi:MAG: protein kinase [Planctomycetes bacterium]|nr:protein kinase [Planctomycetota bacterium]